LILNYPSSRSGHDLRVHFNGSFLSRFEEGQKNILSFHYHQCVPILGIKKAAWFVVSALAFNSLTRVQLQQVLKVVVIKGQKLAQI